MSKSKMNVGDLETLLAGYGAGAIRRFILSASPAAKDLEWTESGVDGCMRFISRLQQMADTIISSEHSATAAPSSELQRLIHHTTKYTTQDIKLFRLNKAIARMRELFNALSDAGTGPIAQ